MPFSLHYLALLIVLTQTLAFPTRDDACSDEHRRDHPRFCRMMDRVIEHPETVALEMKEWAREHNLLIDFRDNSVDIEMKRQLLRGASSSTPVAFAHGMGDSCFNDGMQHITTRTGDLLGGVYSTCVATGKDQHEDTTNGYFLNMNANVDLFAEGVRADPNLKNGFSAIGFSQGNAVIRGYIAKYNDPPVKTFLSVNGVNAGIGAVPYCRPKFAVDEQYHAADEQDLSFSMCDLLMEAASKRFYTSYMQEHSFQANYWRDARPSAQEAYKTYAQLADWNNEAQDVNATYNQNWAKTERFVWVMAEQDQMVWPKEGEHWGAPDPNDPFNSVLPMKQTEWYQKDLFGLRTADEAGKNAFESFDGDHLQFTMKEFDGWVTKYIA